MVPPADTFGEAPRPPVPRPAPRPPAGIRADAAGRAATRRRSAASHRPRRGVGLEHAVETVRLALRAAADRGVTHARISLTPRELGSIEVHLRQTADGLVARVVAEHATAAQLLQQAGGELRRQLESQGLTLLRLDIGAPASRAAAPPTGSALANAPATATRAPQRRQRSDSDPMRRSTAPPTDPTTTTLALPNGALVDVLA